MHEENPALWLPSELHGRTNWRLASAVGSFTGRNLNEFRQVQGREPTQDEMDNVVGTGVVQSALNSALAPYVMAGRGGGSIDTTIDVVKRALQDTSKTP